MPHRLQQFPHMVDLLGQTQQQFSAGIKRTRSPQRQLKWQAMHSLTKVGSGKQQHTY
jgi:hypothetical protein